ncbi:MAG TPA: endonuclease/exonuclease/phosphatase family protein, partial [Polyangiaceae bacterium]|nr:endonuclease/exonuclease/phosphatase family protein [Polyangiaceae bacterium]
MSARYVSPRLTVASYNIHGCVGRDGRRDVERVARVIQSLDADIIALQEVESRRASPRESLQMDVIGHLVGLTAISGPTIERADGHFGNALLTRLPIRAVRRIDLTFRRREPRGAIDVDFDVAGAPVRVIGTHLGLLPRERRHQVQCILETVADQQEGLTVLLGDINEWLVSGRPLRWLHRRFGECHAQRTYPAWFPVFALDRIWVHPKEALLRVEAQNTKEARAASDHLPVRAELTLAAAIGSSSEGAMDRVE